MIIKNKYMMVKCLKNEKVLRISAQLIFLRFFFRNIVWHYHEETTHRV